MENTKTTLTNLDTGIEAIVELDGEGYKLTIRDTDADKTYTHIRHKDRNVLLQKAWQAVSVLVLLSLSACGDNQGFVCVAPPQISNK